MLQRSVIISGMGVYLPKKMVSNDDLAQRIDTSDEWIRTRTGIRQRRIAEGKQACSDLGAIAAQRAIDDAGLAPEAIDMVIVATITADMPFPSTACLLQAKLGLRSVPCFDVDAACSGFIYLLEIASALLLAGSYKNILIVGAEKLSSILDWEDRSTCVLFGDGAGAAVLSLSEEKGVGIIACQNSADGSKSDLLCMPGGGSLQPASIESLKARQHFLKMEGREIFKAAIRLMAQSALSILQEHKISPNELSCIIPHQANARIIDALAVRLRLSLDKFYINLDKYGNTSAASVPIALSEAKNLGRFGSGDYILLLAFGAGLTWGASLIRWH